MIVIYHGRRPYPPLLACAAHLGLDRGAEPFLPAGLGRDWRKAPLMAAGRDEGGAMVFCLVHGRYGGLYRRALTGMAGIFGLSVAWADMDEAAKRLGLGLWLSFRIAAWLPAPLELGRRPALAAAVRPHLLAWEGGS